MADLKKQSVYIWTENNLVWWLRYLTVKQATWGSIPGQSLIFYQFYFVEFIEFDENYGKT